MLLLPLGGDGTRVFQEGHEVAQAGRTAENAEREVSHVTEGFDAIPGGIRRPDGYEFDEKTNIVKYTNWYGQEGQVARNSYDVGQLGENLLIKYLGKEGETQAHRWTKEGELRKVDFLTEEGHAHEVKVGKAKMSAFLRAQIAKDVKLMKEDQVRSVTWHFYRSPITGKIGASNSVLQLLKDAGIKAVWHDF